jgi:hypothetical protein
MLVCMGLVVALNAGLASWWGWTVFGVRAKIESERATLQLEMDGLTPQVTYYHSLESESKQYKTREKTLASITSSRISWTRKMDELIDVANAGGDGSRHLVWLDDLTVTQATDPNGKNFGSVRANGHSGSEKFAQVANFLEDLEISAFVDDFEKPSPPEGTQTLIDESLVPPVAWAFPLALSLKAPEERSKATLARTTKGVKDDAKGATPPKSDASTPQKPDAGTAPKSENGSAPAPTPPSPTPGSTPAPGGESTGTKPDSNPEKSGGSQSSPSQGAKGEGAKPGVEVRR